jgi:hypothetical protein
MQYRLVYRSSIVYAIAGPTKDRIPQSASERITMGHMISVFIGRPDILRLIANDICHSCVVELSQGFSLLPIDLNILDQCTPSRDNQLHSEYSEFNELFPELIASARQHAINDPVAYVETDYFGGHGTQAAILWRGSTIYGPFLSDTKDEKDQFRTTPDTERAINRVLQRLGVKRDVTQDEFDALGLGRFRSNEAWTRYSQSKEDA